MKPVEGHHDCRQVAAMKDDDASGVMYEPADERLAGVQAREDAGQLLRRDEVTTVRAADDV